MELKEAIEILKNLQDWYKEGNMSTTIESSELEALCVVLQTLEESRKENEELKAKQVMQEFKIDWCEKNTISKDKIKEKIEKQTKRIDELLDGMIDKSIGCINVSYLSKKEKEEVIAKRNSLMVQKATLQQVLEELLKGG